MNEQEDYLRDYSTGEIIDVLEKSLVGTKAMMVGAEHTMIMRDEGGVAWVSTGMYLEGNLYTMRRRWRLLIGIPVVNEETPFSHPLIDSVTIYYEQPMQTV